MSERDDLLASILNTVGDYRSGEIAAPTPEHIDRWVNQFQLGVQIPMLREIDHVLKQTYLSREIVSAFLKKLVTNEKLAGSAPRDFWHKTNFLRIQAQGNSQTEFLSLFDTALESEYGFRTNGCGESGGHFVYLDDAMFSGNRAGSDLEKWIREDAPSQTTVHVIVMVIHTLCEYQVKDRLGKVLTEAGKDIQIKYWRSLTIENRKYYKNEAEVLWPADLPDDDELNAYLAMPHKYPFEPRDPGGNIGHFSSEEGRQLLENQFTLAGIKIRNFSHNPSDALRPLGFSPFGLGFGSMIVTFRNCPNNCPLALWWGDTEARESHPFSNWYPLFPRETYD